MPRLNRRPKIFGQTGLLSAGFIVLALALCLALPHLAQAASSVEYGAIITIPRAAHTATLLQNGKLLVVGGRGIAGEPPIEGPLASAELFDPAALLCTDAGSLSDNRFLHTATLLQNGKVLVVGGLGASDVLNSAELYDPAADEGAGGWTPVQPMPEELARYGHTATLLEDGRVLVVGGSGSGATLNSAVIFDPAANDGAGAWTTTGSLTTARVNHTATLLPDGKVLVAGGYDGATYLNSAELFDPAGGSGYGAWSNAGTFATGREQHTATLLPDGKVLVAGGYDGATYLNSIELYTGSGWDLTPLPALGTGRAGHTATLLPNGKVLVTGGYGIDPGPPPVYGDLYSAELFDPAADDGAGAWTTTESLITACEYHTATLLPNGQVLLVGGYDGTNYLSCAGFFDFAAPAWSAAAGLPVGRNKHTATLLPDGKVLVAAGASGVVLNSALLFTPNSTPPLYGSWSTTGNLQTARYSHTATLLADGTVLVVGGFNTESLATTELYVDGSWEATGDPDGPGPLETGRFSHTATLLADGRVLVVGGKDTDGNYLSSAEVYDPVAKTWSTTGSTGQPRYLHTATLLPSGRVLVTGGYYDDAEIGVAYLDSAELYNPATGLWTPTGNLRIGRCRHTATLLPNGQVMVVGGFGRFLEPPEDKWLTSTLFYDPATGTWSTHSDDSPGEIDDLNTARELHTATLLPSGKVLVAGGYGIAGDPPTEGTLASAELFDPLTRLWETTDSLGEARETHTATLLANGKVLVAGGFGSPNSGTTADLFDPGLGFDDSWRPVINTVTPSPDPPLGTDKRLLLDGTGFRGISGGSGGGTMDSPTDYPLVHLRRLDSERTIWLPPDPTEIFNASSFDSAVFQDFQTGHCMVTVFANGIPSESKLTLFYNTGPPTAVELASFEAVPYPDQIVLEWETRTELDNYGFYLWRADLGKSNYKRITGLIPARGDGTSGAFYEYADTDVTAGQSYSYKLEDVSVSGKSTFHGPVEATVGYLNLLAPEDGAQLSLAAPPEFRWEALPFDRFRLQFCVADDFSGQIVGLPQARGKKGADWLTQTSYTPTDREWSAVKGLVGRKGGWLCWRVVGAYGAATSYSTEPFSFHLAFSKSEKGAKQ